MASYELTRSGRLRSRNTTSERCGPVGFVVIRLIIVLLLMLVEISTTEIPSLPLSLRKDGA